MYGVCVCARRQIHPKQDTERKKKDAPPIHYLPGPSNYPRKSECAPSFRVAITCMSNQESTTESPSPDYRKKLVPTYSNLSTGGPRPFGCPYSALQLLFRAPLLLPTAHTSGAPKRPHGRILLAPTRGPAGRRTAASRTW